MKTTNFQIIYTLTGRLRKRKKSQKVYLAPGDLVCRGMEGGELYAEDAGHHGEGQIFGPRGFGAHLCSPVRVGLRGRNSYLQHEE